MNFLFHRFTSWLSYQLDPAQPNTELLCLLSWWMGQYRTSKLQSETPTVILSLQTNKMFKQQLFSCFTILTSLQYFSINFLSCTDGKISVRIIYFYYLFFHRRPLQCCFLSGRPFVVNATISTGLVGCWSFFCLLVLAVDSWGRQKKLQHPQGLLKMSH